MFSPIHIDFAKIVTPLIEQNHLSRSWNDLERVIGKQDARYAERIAGLDKRIRIGGKIHDDVWSVSVPFGIEFRFSGRLKRSRFPGKIKNVAASAYEPDSRKVRL